MTTHSFTTSTVGKGKIFEALALSHATGYPLLIIGVHGTAKTKAVLEYASGFTKSKTFKLELSEGTRISEITGYLDMNKLINEKIEHYIAPITNADCIVMNEIDKANSSVRNAMLGIMAEKMIMRGVEEMPLKYNLFVATCNAIDESDEEKPFWDRFVIKINSARLTQTNMLETGLILKDVQINFDIPDEKEIMMNTLSIQQELIDKYVSVMYEHISDRTLFKSINMISAAMLIWKLSAEEAIIKVTGFIKESLVTNMSKLIMSDNIEQHKRHIDKLVSNARDIPFVMSQLDIYAANIDKTAGLSTSDKKKLSDYALMRRNELSAKFVKL